MRQDGTICLDEHRLRGVARAPHRGETRNRLGSDQPQRDPSLVARRFVLQDALAPVVFALVRLHLIGRSEDEAAVLANAMEVVGVVGEFAPIVLAFLGKKTDKVNNRHLREFITNVYTPGTSNTRNKSAYIKTVR